MSKGILNTYRKRLINLTGNNRSIVLLRLVADQMLDLHEVGFLLQGGAFSVIEALIAGKSKKICHVLDSRLEAGNVISNRLKRIHRFDRFIFEERGSTDLHVGWPFVHGKFADGSLVRAPLLYFPVSLAMHYNEWVLQPREDAGISFNKSLLLAYSHYNKVSLEDEFMEMSFDDFDPEATAWRTRLYELLKDKIEINFNVETFHDEIKPFQTFKKSEFDPTHKAGELKLLQEAVLGIFPQATSQLVPDYEVLIDTDSFTDFETFFEKRNTLREGSDTLAREERRYIPFPVDAWQEEVIIKAKQGNSLVVQGPPGTGKSQLICNLIADAIATGKRILVVCQKRAALDVVYKRLREIELADFLGLVHDFKNDRKELFDKIARQIDRIEEFKTRNRGVDIIQAERKFLQLSRTIDQIAEELDEYKRELYDDSECGKSIKELYLSSDPTKPTINLKLEFEAFHYSRVDEFIRSLRRYADLARRYEADDYLWRVRRSFANYSIGDMKEIIERIHDIPTYTGSLIASVNKIIPLTLSLEDYEVIQAREEDILGMVSVIRNDTIYHYLRQIVEVNEGEANWLWLSNMERVIMSCFEEEGPESSLSSAQLGTLQVALKQRMDARRSLIRRIRWAFFSEHNYWIKRVLVANELPYNKHGLRALEQRLDNRLNLEHQITSLRARSWLVDIPEDISRAAFRKWFDRYKLAFRARAVFTSLRDIREVVSPARYSRIEFVDLFHNLLSTLGDIEVRKKDWLTYLTPQLIRTVGSNPASIDKLVDTLRYDFDNLCAFDKLRDTLNDKETRVITKLHEACGDWDKLAMEELFMNSLAITWIEYLETKHPVLRIVSSNRMEELQAELQHAIGEKRRLSKEILLVKAREGVYEEIAYNRLNNRVTYRDLHHQVTKKKKVWPLRKLILEYGEEIFHLVPCWLASPESVSALFPMTEMFDLVIFDEASQCFAERGLPSMYRGKQVLIAGDDKQLRPFELYQVRWEDGSEEVDLEVESLLDLSQRYIGTAHLQGHYRSRSPELIDFSNRHFYGGKLHMLPDYSVLTNYKPSIKYEKVPGIWDQQTNQVEADHIVAGVIELLKLDPDKEIGIVTFNAPQQYLILDELESMAAKEGLLLPASLMVKNIENVQGDEKDIIIFSIGYAPDKNGKMNMQFGSLGVPGGENRLNVAITRARERIIVVASIDPEQLRVEESKNDGPRLLKEYLRFAKQVHEGSFSIRHHHSLQSPANGLREHLVSFCNSRFPALEVQVGRVPFSDVMLKNNQVPTGLLLTDDDRLYQSLSAKEFHAYSFYELNRKHWEYSQVFTRNYWLDKNSLEASIVRVSGMD